jgi:hypothetical protein
MQEVLANVDPKLANIAQSAGSLEFGIYYAKEVEFEFESTQDSEVTRRASLQSLKHPQAASLNKESLLPVFTLAGNNNTSRGAIKLSMRQYKAWLSEVNRYSERTLFP